MKVIDLFCGCGGFSHGFNQAGHEIVLGIDFDKRVEKTYTQNHPDTEFIRSDIRDLDAGSYLRKACDIVIGSPPCPNFSIANNKADITRGMILVKEFLKWVDVLKPKWWIMENVPPIRYYLDERYPYGACSMP